MVGSNVNPTQFVANGVKHATALVKSSRKLDLSLTHSFSPQTQTSHHSNVSVSEVFPHQRENKENSGSSGKRKKKGQITFMPSPPSLDSLSLKKKLYTPVLHSTSPFHPPPLSPPLVFTFSEAAKTSKLIKVGESPFNSSLNNEDKPSNRSQVVHFCQMRELRKRRWRKTRRGGGTGKRRRPLFISLVFDELS